jgi:Zn-dependent peptidase ImmA (M78 family)
MEQERPENIIDRVRALMPIRTLGLVDRPLRDFEARVIAERQAILLLRLLGITKPSVEIERIAELPNVEVEVRSNLPHSGASDWVVDHWHIQINIDDSLWRCRSTLAHEIKHALDDPYREPLYPDWPHGSQLPPPAEAEAICDYFAGCLLVPAPWLRQAWDHGIQDVAELASVFDVSEALITVRLRQVGLAHRGRPTDSRYGRASRDRYHRDVYRMARHTPFWNTTRSRTSNWPTTSVGSHAQ